MPTNQADGPTIATERGDGPKKTELSRQRVVSAALGILDAEGAGALNMRHLAEVLGVGTMSLYHYVSDKDDLTDAVIELVLDDVHRPRVGEPWVEMARAVSISFRAAALSHPGAIRLFLTRRPTATSPLQWGAMSQVLRDSGMTEEQRRRVFRAVSRFLVGWCLAEIVELGDSGERRRASGTGDFIFALDALLEALADRVR